MNRNPVNILNDVILKAAEIASNAVRLSIISIRLKKFNSIDLRRYRGHPEKKERIRAIIVKLAFAKFSLINNFIMIASQPIQIHVFAPGGIIVGESEETIIKKSE